jgi:hypothetical protein
MQNILIKYAKKTQDRMKHLFFVRLVSLTAYLVRTQIKIGIQEKT